MKKSLIVLMAIGAISVFAGDGAFVYNGKRLKDNSKQAILFFRR